MVDLHGYLARDYSGSCLHLHLNRQVTIYIKTAQVIISILKGLTWLRWTLNARDKDWHKIKYNVMLVSKIILGTKIY